MKKLLLFLVAASMVVAYSCKKTKNTISTAVTPESNPINQDTLCGYIRGTMLSGKTYYIKCDIQVKNTDTLYIENNVTVKVLNNSAFYISGTLISEGTQSSPITFTSFDNSTHWGGFQCDTANYVSFKWTHINYTGGPDSSGSARKSLYIARNIPFVFHDSWLFEGQDDGLRCQGAQVSILRSTFQHNGTTDGEAINMKDGATGDIAYNYIWSQAGSGIKLETNATILLPQTRMNVYNNTVVNSGFRRGAGEPGRGVNVDLSTAANVYNNIFVNVYRGLEITQLADTNNVHYGNNLFYAVDDSVKANYYPAGNWGKQQPTDKINVNPMLTGLDGNIMNTSDNNNPHLQSGSPAIGAGVTTLPNLGYIPLSGGDAGPSADLGAYPSNGSGNLH
ncbi:MAG: hypothetical protein JSS82_10970 [Bacteroidetes bacterium]|nr:hypothetical protein [Bacteroidota bacterium]